MVELDEENIPELIDEDTDMYGEINTEHYIRYHDELETILEGQKSTNDGTRRRRRDRHDSMHSRRIR